MGIADAKADLDFAGYSRKTPFSLDVAQTLYMLNN